MKKTTLNQWTIAQSLDLGLETRVDAFLLDQKAQGLSKGTIFFYEKKLEIFSEFCQSQIITEIPQITPLLIREYLVWLEKRGHNNGGIHAFFRTLRTFLYWWESEVEPENWRNPIRKVKAPKMANLPIEPVSMDDIQKMLKVYGDNFTGLRDKAIILCLFDTGVRASELCAMDIDHVDQISGEILIPHGKGRKPRTVFMGKKSRRAYRAYLKRTMGNSLAVWQTIAGERLTYAG
jgi:integrase/recombinase XerD